MSKRSDQQSSNTRSFGTGAVRSADANGVRYDLISPIGLRRVAETYAEGAARYGANNWRKGFPFSDLLNHLQKHIEQFKAGDESEDHLAHAAWGLFAIMEFQETKPAMDDRYAFAARQEGASS